jgi:hypothetical protein
MSDSSQVAVLNLDQHWQCILNGQATWGVACNSSMGLTKTETHPSMLCFILACASMRLDTFQSGMHAFMQVSLPSIF